MPVHIDPQPLWMVGNFKNFQLIYMAEPEKEAWSLDLAEPQAPHF